MRRNLSRHLTACLGLLLLSCTQQYKPSGSYRSQKTAGTAPGAANQSPVAVTDNPITLIVSNTKLAPTGGTFTAKISYGGQTVSQDFTPTGTQSTLSLANLPVGTKGVMTVEFYQADALRFIAKKSNTALLKSGTNNVVVDDCMILRAPWPGTTNDGSCDWTITEL